MPKRNVCIAALVVLALIGAGLVLWLPGRTQRITLTPEVQAALGAAVYVPQDASAYAAHFGLGPSCKAIWHSNAVQNLVALPVVQQFWTQAQHHPAFRQFILACETEPVLVQGLPILEDAVSSEVFACTGPDLPGFLTAFSAVTGSLQFSRLWRGLDRLRGEEDADASPAANLVAAVLENEKNLQFPSLLLGFKLTKPAAARDFLDNWVPQIGPTPLGAFAKKDLRPGPAHVLAIHGERVFGAMLGQLPRALERQGVPPEHARRLAKWLAELQACVAVGVFGDYLILSIGKDTALLDQWGRGGSVAQLPEFEPIRTSLKPGLQSLSYTSAKLGDVFGISPDDVRRFAQGIAESLPEAPETKGLKERILKDADELIKDVDFPKPAASAACSFANKGTESLSFGGPPGGSLDFSQPLTILAHRTKHPILFSASRSAKASPDAYPKLVKWLKTFYGYFLDYVLPTAPPDVRKHYDTIMAFTNPFLTELDDATRTLLIPALDGAQYLLVLDGEGTLSAFPDGTRPPKAIPIPRLAIAIELADPDKFTQAIERYVAAARKLIADARKAYPKHIPPEIAIPSPVVADTAAGKQVYYPLPWNLGQDVFPCALLKGRLLILASSSNLARDMTQTVPMPTCAVTSPDKAAGAVAGADLSRAWGLFRGASDAIFALITADRRMRPDDHKDAMLVKMHLDALWRSLGALRSYSSTTTLRNGRVVTHSWLHVEDVPK